MFVGMMQVLYNTALSIDRQNAKVLQNIQVVPFQMANSVILGSSHWFFHNYLCNKGHGCAIRRTRLNGQKAAHSKRKYFCGYNITPSSGQDSDEAQALNESVDEVSLIDSLNFSNGFQEFSEYGILQSLTVLQATIQSFGHLVFSVRII